MFAHHEEEEEVYHLTLTEIADAQPKDNELKAYFKINTIMQQKDMGIQLIEDTKVLCKNGKVMIPTSLRRRAVRWYHHYLQHPGHSCLEETMKSVMYWKGMRTTIQKHVKSCRSCQVNKVWCKPGWDKNFLNVTFLRLFLMSKVELWTLFQRIQTQYNNHSTICYS